MNMIGHQVALLDPALLPSRQIVKYLAQVPLDLPEQQFLAVLRRKHDVVLAVLAIPSFFEIKESDGARSFPKRISDVIFFEARADCKLERGKRTRESPILIK